MRIYLFTAVLLASLGAVQLLIAPKAESATCYGAADCRACKNCKYCKHCQGSGTCGICK